MAKETAHQLGTPLSSLAGWLELMASRAEAGGTAPGDGEGQSVEDIAREMQRDMRRLNQIASRFSQIGSVPELRRGDVTEVIEETLAYFRNRGPQFGRHRFETRLEPVEPVPMNAELMGWALENLIKNSMDAVGTGQGVIEVQVGPHPDREAARIAVTDNGRGIEPENLSRVFDPGFSTKKRGWGLGLAFVKRIVEEYHGGRIQILRSEKGEGTTIEICLPLV
jgi:signal transduction histidine kinase